MVEMREPIAIEFVDSSTYVDLTPTSAVFEESTPYEVWEAIGGKLQESAGSINWWLGDWLEFGEHAYGETYTQAIDVTGLDYDALRQMKWVASQVQMDTRVNQLSWTHHREVASLEPEEQEAWLRRALDGEHGQPWSSRRLKEEIEQVRLRDVARANIRNRAAIYDLDFGDDDAEDDVAAEAEDEPSPAEVEREVARIRALRFLHESFSGIERLLDYPPDEIAGALTHEEFLEQYERMTRTLNRWSTAIEMEYQRH